ncbi:MAG: hypothetical protein WCY84_05020 [Candidatus Cloacimonadaceae bacterium]
MIAILIDNKLQHFMNEIKFSFRYIFDNRGYAYRFINNIDELKQNDIFIIYSPTEPDEKSVKDLAKKLITIFIICEMELYERVSYNPERLRRNMRELKLLYPTQVITARPFNHAAENYIDSDTCGGKINIDVVGNIYFHLSQAEQIMQPGAKGNERFIDENSAFYPHRDSPAVDSMLWLIESMLKEHARTQRIPLAQKALWPKNESCALMLCHSVENLQKWNASSLILSLVDNLGLLFTLKLQQLFHNLKGQMQYIFTNYELYWNFEEYRRLEKENNCRSCFYLAVETGEDIDYSLEDPDLQEEIQACLNEGCEIGLILSNDKLTRDEMLRQKQVMLHQLARSDLGIKQYGYTWNLEIMELQDKIEPKYSISTAFKEAPGFYNSCSFPYHPYINGKASYLILPSVFRDNYLHINKRKLMTLDHAKSELKRYFQKVSKTTHGIFSLDFSLAAYHDIRYAQNLYSYFLALISSSNAWNATPLEIADWWEKRARVTIQEGEYEISVYFPDDLPSFALHIQGEQKVREIDGISAKIDGNTLHFNNVKAESVAVIRLVQ